MTAYYNEFDPDAAAWLRELIKMGLIAPGDVDERSITDVHPDDLRGYVQCHFFAGIGGWSYAARLAGWPDDKPLWTGSCPCQPFSVAGKGGGVDDPRHLWPHLFRLIHACRPPVVMGEQVAGAAGYGWFDGVRADLARENYAGRAVDFPACAVDAPHIRQRLYWIAVANANTRGLLPSGCGSVPEAPGGDKGDREERKRLWADAGERNEPRDMADASRCGSGGRAQQPAGHVADGDQAGWVEGADRASSGDEGVDPYCEVGSCCHNPNECSGQYGECWLARNPDKRPADYWTWLDDEGVDLVDPSGLGRGEGRPEPGVRGGRPAAAGTDAPGVALGDACSAGLSPPERQAVLGAGRRGEGRAAAEPDGAFSRRNGTFWSDAEWIACHDGKARRAQPGISLLAHGVSRRVAKWRGFGNAIVSHAAAEVIRAFLDVERVGDSGE